MKHVNRSLLILLAALLTACTNPFFEDLLGKKAGRDPAVYTVTFQVNDGTDTALTEKTVTAPATTLSAADFPDAPARSGYTFGGWNTQADGSGDTFTDSTTVSGDMTVYAKWTAASYAIAYTLNGGTNNTANPESYTIESAAITLAAPGRAGYLFGGWYDDAAFTGSAVTAIPAGSSGDKAFYARWTGETWTVTFKSNDGTNDTLYTKAVTVPATAIGAADFPDAPARSGYTFGGWNTQADGSGDTFDASTTVSGDMTVYARWTAASYAITYTLNGGTNNTANPESYTIESAAITLAAPGRADYIFEGWYDDAAFTGSAVTAIPAGSSGDKAFYARWTGETWTVTFKGNDGTNDTLYTRAVTVPATAIDAGDFPGDPARTGYLFGGWNTARDGSGTAFDASTTVSGDITVYAQWTAGIITLDPDAGGGAFGGADFTLSKSGAGGVPANKTIAITGTGYTNPQWMVDGVLTSTETSITIDAADYGLGGGHRLSLLIRRNGVIWSKDIAFTVTE